MPEGGGFAAAVRRTRGATVFVVELNVWRPLKDPKEATFEAKVLESLRERPLKKIVEGSRHTYDIEATVGDDEICRFCDSKKSFRDCCEPVLRERVGREKRWVYDPIDLATSQKNPEFHENLLKMSSKKEVSQVFATFATDDAIETLKTRLHDQPSFLATSPNNFHYLGYLPVPIHQMGLFIFGDVTIDGRRVLFKASSQRRADLIIDDLTYVSLGLQRAKAPQCEACHSRTNTLKKCSACKKVFYCSNDCQRTHWKAHHKNHCLILQKQENK